MCKFAHRKRVYPDMKLIIMTLPTFFVEEDKILTSLFDEGLDNLHLYKPNSTPIYSERLLTLINSDYHSKITVHEHFYLKEEYRLRGIHIDDATTPVPQGYKGRLCRTCHSIDELKEAKKKSDYVFLNNVFDNMNENKGNDMPAMDNLREAARKGLIDKKVYALGGVNADNANMAKELGFGGVVICEDLWDKFNIHRESDYKELINHFERLRKTIC